MFAGAGELAYAARAERFQPREHFADEHFGRRSARGYPDAGLAADPAWIELVGAIDHVRRNAAMRGDFAQAIRIRAVGAADDDDDVDFWRHELDRVLTVLCRIADIVSFRTHDAREPALQRVHDGGGIVDRKRGLRDVGQIGRVGNRQPLHIADRFDEVDAAFTLPHRPFDLRMPAVADHHDGAPLVAHSRDFDMDLGDERTGRVEYGEAARLGVGTDRLRDAMRREYDGAPGGHLVQFIDENRALRLEIVDDKFVVDDLVPHVDRRAVLRKRLFDNRNRAVDARAEPARIREQNIHQFPPVGTRRRPSPA